ncbi:arsenic resistance protein [Povalibacter uvarum]|uniref:arsenic resistance protein n=1 Tax=Povalibacter uvarum TaxID=732238 RepID=UPI00161883A6
MTRAWLERHQIAIYFGSVAFAAIAGVAAPGTARGFDVLITPAIAVLMYVMFLQIPFLSLRAALGNRRFISALLLANFVLIPLVVWALTAQLADDKAIMIGALLVLLTPCIDYVVVFTHLGKGDSRLVLSATPILLLLQFALLPLYLSLMLGSDEALSISFAPFIEAFLFLIAVPLILAVATEALTARSRAVRAWRDIWLWLPVPAMAAVLMLVIASQVPSISRDATKLMAVLPIYALFVVLAPAAGALAARIFALPAAAARAVAFSSATRNSLVVLPLALALPPDLRTLAAATVIAQTLVELVAELIYLRAIPAMIWRHAET